MSFDHPNLPQLIMEIETILAGIVDERVERLD